MKVGDKVRAINLTVWKDVMEPNSIHTIINGPYYTESIPNVLVVDIEPGGIKVSNPKIGWAVSGLTIVNDEEIVNPVVKKTGWGFE